MLRTLLFLAAESLLFTAALSLSWLVVKRAFALVGVMVGRLGLVALPVTWVVLLAVNFGLTRVWGPSFTALYRMSAMALLGSLALFVLCAVLRRARPAGAEPS
jgi:hypothetical protein